VKPPSFAYSCPRSLDEALELLAAHGDDAKLLAGGQSLMPMLNLRFAEPRVLVDVNRLPDLGGIRRDDGTLRIGAMTRHRTIETSPLAAAADPLLCRAAREIGHLAIRNRGTIGGSLAHADPAAEWPLVAAALGARITLRSAKATRTIAARDFFLAPLTTAARADEMLTEVAFPAAAANDRWGFCELSRRPGDFAVVAVACRVTVDDSGACRAATLAVAGAHATPLWIADVERLLVGRRPSDDAIREAAEAAMRAVEPAGDVHGSAPYRRRMVGVLTVRALTQAFGRAGEAR
jgi:CO/xanthine dehydrogenase FAD-binding subunit